MSINVTHLHTLLNQSDIFVKRITEYNLNIAVCVTNFTAFGQPGPVYAQQIRFIFQNVNRSVWRSVKRGFVDQVFLILYTACTLGL